MRFRGGKVRIAFAFALAGAGLPFSRALAQEPVPSCPSLYRQIAQPRTAYGEIRKGFQHNTHYSVEVPHPSAVRDQCDLGTCSLHAWASVLEDAHHARTGKPLTISTRYWSWYHWRKRTLDAVDKLEKVDLQALKDPRHEIPYDAALEPSLGTDAFESRDLIREAGAIPDSVFPTTDHFQLDPIAQRAGRSLSNVLARAKLELSRKITPAQEEAIRRSTKERIHAIFASMIGKPPENFEYGGKTYTPQSFAREELPEIQEPLVRMHVKKTRGFVMPKFEGEEELQTYNTIKDVETVARQLLDRGKSVYLFTEYDPSYVDRASGIMSIRAFSTPVGGRPLARKERIALGLAQGNHAVQLVGYDLDPATGKVIKWKIKNSFGEGMGDHGFYHMYDDYFRAFVNGMLYEKNADVHVPSEAAYLDAQEKAAAAREARARAKAAGR